MKKIVFTQIYNKKFQIVASAGTISDLYRKEFKSDILESALSTNYIRKIGPYDLFVFFDKFIYQIAGEDIEEQFAKNYFSTISKEFKERRYSPVLFDDYLMGKMDEYNSSNFSVDEHLDLTLKDCRGAYDKIVRRGKQLEETTNLADQLNETVKVFQENARKHLHTSIVDKMWVFVVLLIAVILILKYYL